MHTVTQLAEYSDDDGNAITFDGTVDTGVKVVFRGRGNRMIVHAPIKLGRLDVVFDCDDGVLEIGPSRGVAAFSGKLRVGQDAAIRIGRNVSTTNPVVVSAVEGAAVTVGDDVMIASGVQLRSDDGHPIFDVRTGKRVNPARSISVGSHVWLAGGAAVLGGTTIGDGSVVGLNAVVKGRFPNNCVIAGVPARVIRRHIAWERPHLSFTPPFYKPDASTVKKSTQYWNLTADDGEDAAPPASAPTPTAAKPATPAGRPSLARRAVRRLRRLFPR